MQVEEKLTRLFIMVFHFKIKDKLILMSLLLVLIPILLLGLTTYQILTKETKSQNEDRLKQQTQQILQNVKNIYDLALQKVNTDLEIAKYLLNNYGQIQVDDSGKLSVVDIKADQLVRQKVKSDIIIANKLFYDLGTPELNTNQTLTRQVKDQITLETTTLRFNPLRIGDKNIPYDYGLVDQIKNTTGIETATIFQKIPQGYLRVSTNVINKQGERAINTYIPNSSEVAKQLSQGTTYYGRAYVVDSWYLTAYEPIKNRQGIIIGALYVGAHEQKYIPESDHDLVDRISKLTGSTATVFQLKPFQGRKPDDSLSQKWNNKDAFYRISTNILLDSGQRATGTILSQAIYDQMKQGNTYLGRANILGHWYMTAYYPLKDNNGHLVGALYVGVPESQYQDSLIKNLRELTIGKTGRIYILDEKGESLLGDYKGERYTSHESTPIIAYQDRLIYSQSYFAPWEWQLGAIVNMSDFEEGLRRINFAMMIIILLTIIIGTIIAFKFAQSLAIPLQKVSKNADILANGDFNINPMNYKKRDEIGLLEDSFNKMVISLKEKADIINSFAKGDFSPLISKSSEEDQLGESLLLMSDNLNNLLYQIDIIIREVQIGANHISTASQDLSRGVITQADSVEKILDNLKAIDQQSTENSQGAQSAHRIAQMSKKNAEDSANQIEELILSVHNIKDSFDGIKKIVGIISSLSFQINLLALNANVEAARAGQHGRGFSVVADEVRTLANKSEASVKDTSGIIEQASIHMEDALEAVTKTSSLQSTILKGAQELSEVVAQIKKSSSSQAEGVNRITEDLNHISNITTENAAASEESSAATEQLTGQILELQNMMKQFKLRAKDSQPRLPINNS